MSKARRDEKERPYLVNKKLCFLPVLERVAHRHGLCCCGGLVQQRGVGQRHACEVGNHRLEVQQRLESSLSDLGLVRSVCGVPGEHVSCQVVKDE